jgi:hypothetical protein
MYVAIYSSQMRLSGLAFGWSQCKTKKDCFFSFLGREGVCPTRGG